VGTDGDVVRKTHDVNCDQRNTSRRPTTIASERVGDLSSLSHPLRGFSMAFPTSLFTASQPASLLSAEQRARCARIALAIGESPDDVIAEAERVARATQGMTERQREQGGIRDLARSTGRKSRPGSRLIGRGGD